MSQVAISSQRIVVLAGPGKSTDILFHALDREFGVQRIIVETPVSQKQLLKRRGEKLGWSVVVGQILFKLLIAKPLEAFSQGRLHAIRTKEHLDDRPIPEDRISRVASVNSAGCIEELQRLQPDVVVVNGTRIIAKKALMSVPCRFINTHAGITPLYRGVHGGYWALANNDQTHCGVSVHLVDSGIDTGGIIAQALIHPTPEDNFVTYPLLQLAAGLPLLMQAIRDVLKGEVKLRPAPEGGSRLWSHPTLLEYLGAYSRSGIR
ncbi:formyl transferase domain protein [Hymenobacter roseosalivarius DSM 11622]|uniref:phosphoribosylglycinamide formyltransferase 1 n=1 Tax=Hymenobacter roseosalivarius DSM 11622 TaxID=645990 RepID=A0A1W1V8K9_9BACT|nr:formyl transferase [Hymenobacter roseosalivarius]SMB89583.1 formyl transferase domain protein [Hymenobacter roseosalivarius DSM 11622]